MRPLLLSPMNPRQETKTTENGRLISHLHITSVPASLIRSYFQLLIHKSIYSLACVNMSKNERPKGRSGEYRGRTDDLLHAMQAL